MPLYNWVENNWNYSDMTGNFWFYSEDEAANFNVDIADADDFKSFECKTKLMGQTEADGATGIFGNRIAMQLKYLSNFWESLEMTLINCKVQLKLKWKNHCGLSANVNGDFDGCSNNIIFTIKDIKLDVITLSAKGNQKQIFLEKDLKDQCM